MFFLKSPLACAILFITNNVGEAAYAASMSMNNSRNSIDYLVKRKATGMNLIAKILLVIFYIVFFAGTIVFCFLKLPIIITVAVGGVIAVLTYIVFSLTWRFVNYEYRYQIYVPSAGMGEVPHTVFQLDKMMSDNKKQMVPHPVYKNEMRNADLIAPYVPEKKAEYAAADVKKTIDFRSAPSITKDVYFLRFKETDGSKTVVIVEAVNKIVDSFKHYAKDVTEVVELSR